MRLAVIDSRTVLWGQTVAYTAYVLVITALVGWFALRITREGRATPIPPKAFYTLVGFLAVLGFSLHIVSYNTIPWTPTDVNRDSIEADRTFQLSVADHGFTLPAVPMAVTCDQNVLFEVESEDLTYGFGLFGEDGFMAFQMQVVPGHTNDVLWRFEENGMYDLRSTEYSGPEGVDMIVPGAVEVTGCPQ
jgi:cytochrome c oxidase subunit 2